ncbi:MAG: NarK family nitrate/nitrite MFS transporter [Ottowia sp.]|nr:NarK family nitrate/nitrite MFS transporter [Ottowia sp.]
MSALLTQWEPENPEFWQSTGKKVAFRNLWISIPALTLAFSIWMLWSIVAVNLNKAGFNFTTNQLFWLTALPSLSGATLRVFYSFLVPIFGGRRWTTISTALMLIPAIGMGFALRDPTTSYGTLLVLALLCGFGGGNFSSSMANINYFFPKAQKGMATGMNAGIGNLGVSLMQFLVPMAIGASLFGDIGGEPHGGIWLQNAAFIWVVPIALTVIAAWFGMNDLATAKASFADQAVIFKRKHNWIMCWLYIGTFGSFIGFSAGFAMLTKVMFPDVNPMTYAFLGPLVGSITRVLGGWISDKLGGARVTLLVFIGMVISVFLLMLFIPEKLPDGTFQGGNFWGFFAVFILLFALSGVGNGSTFRMIPIIFLTERTAEAKGKGEAAEKQALVDATKESAAVLGFSGAIGAFGGFFIPLGLKQAATGNVSVALWGFIIFYASCVALTWYWYARRNAPVPC